jgi:hypothetical protein
MANSDFMLFYVMELNYRVRCARCNVSKAVRLAKLKLETDSTYL